ncbi:Protein OS-9 homolog [Seminavis robusta]|uniref:Protein OS-9 homolog n=1 Tax=Seminavis robusta TaxID=568900 RepID=A0A9N8HKC6_9STRA|nr:Protein OS-9 homolog [Seminavis robusta]|eukprot:Sro828_g207930.1 Protein OS-9 homolog (559) ;mRNA; r:4215-6010
MKKSYRYWRQSFRLFFRFYIFLFCSGQPQARPFQRDDEYNEEVLDPISIYGSPYGGYSRATQSRLASLPLKLPDQVLRDNDALDDEVQYWEIADGLGRNYACRAYNEDDLEPESMKDSMFQVPMARTSVDVENQKNRDVAFRAARVLGHGRRKVDPALHDLEDSSVNEEGLDDEDDFGPDEERTLDDRTINEFTILDIEQKVDVLDNVCVQKRIGYWTYEWCWEGKIHRFHLNVPPQDADNNKRIKVERVSLLGYHDNRKIRVPSEDHPSAYKREPEAEPMVGSRKGTPTDIALAALTRIREDPNRPCRYIMDVCTPVLCEETDVYDIYEQIDELGLEDDVVSDDDNDDDNGVIKAMANRPSTIEFLTVSNILDETLGDNCLYSARVGWWTYEYCHKHYIRQFHGPENASGKAKPNFKKTNPADDTHFLLGYYNKDRDPLSEPEEWRHIVNRTSDTLLEGLHGTVRHGGNGAYFELEYTNGEVCLLEDPSENEFPAMERACTVRLSCDSTFAVSVQEDSTCHYIVEVTIPSLCRHPLFKPATTRKRIVKCLETFDEQG